MAVPIPRHFAYAIRTAHEEQEICNMQKVISILADNFQNLTMHKNRIDGLMQNLQTPAAISGDGFQKVFLAILRELPLELPSVGYVINCIVEELPLPTNEVILEFAERFQLSSNRTTLEYLSIDMDRNICILLGCLAEKVTGPNSNIIFTRDIMEYLCAFLVNHRHPQLALQALIALEKFAFTNENKVAIMQHLANQHVNPLLTLESLANSNDADSRQLGFTAKWILDNIFTVADRRLSYELVNMANINVILKVNPESTLMKLSADGLEARNDAGKSGGLRATMEVDNGAWYYEVKLITVGSMEFGFGTTDTDIFQNKILGLDKHSVGYDGWRKLRWFQNKGQRIHNVSLWKSGDIVGCLLDINKREIVFTLNGRRVLSFYNIFYDFSETRKKVARFYAAASLSTLQQARFNFGAQSFAFPPKDRVFSTFNDYGRLTNEQKKIKPRFLMERERLDRAARPSTDTCVFCNRGTPSIALRPCGHEGFCAECTLRFTHCPQCWVKLQ